jgi:hypothetical protein
LLSAICYLLCSSPKPFEKRITPLGELFFESLRAIALTARPWLLAIQVAAIFACMRILYAEQFEIFLPIGPFLCEWRRAETNFDPTDRAIAIEPGIFHIAEIFIASDGTASQRPFVNGPS